MRLSTIQRFYPWLASGALCLLGFGVLVGLDESQRTLALAAGALGLLGLLLFAMGVQDLLQTQHAVRRNYPITGRLRYALETVRPEIRQYFFESDDEKLPFSRNQRAMVYARAKGQNDKRGMGSLKDFYAQEAEWIAHSMFPTSLDPNSFRTTVGAETCAQPYAMSIFNISGMSFGSLSGAAIRALNRGAALGGFAQNTGEGSLSPHHEQGGDIVLQVASGYFGFRTPAGDFCPETFALRAAHPQVKMIELKLSQGAKPGHGGILPGAKVTPEIAAVRGIPAGQTCHSPASHPMFSDVAGLVKFIQQLRVLSQGKPVGIKLCLGSLAEWQALVASFGPQGAHPDFITVDGGEGGTGAAPVEFADHVGMPLRDALAHVHQGLLTSGWRSQIRLGAAGKVISAFDIVRCLALGADWCNSARGFMFSIGCIQARSCHTDHCPTGVATQDPLRQRALVPEDKAVRVFNYHRSTLQNLAELLGAAGVHHPSEVGPQHITRRQPR